MTAHFTTMDGCERWAQVGDLKPTEFYRVPFVIATPASGDPNAGMFTPRGTTYAYRTYKLQSIDYARGLVDYLEVYNG